MSTERLGPQFEQLQMLMTPKEIGDVRSGDYGFVPMRQVPGEMRRMYQHQSEKNAMRGIHSDSTHLDRVQESIGKRGFEESVKVVHSQTLPGMKSLYDGHHRAVTAMEQNRLLPVLHYDNHKQAVDDIMSSPTWVRDHS